MPKVAATFLLKLIWEHALHVPVSEWLSHLSLGAEQQELSGLPEALGCSSGQNSPEPWAHYDGDHRHSSHMALQGMCLLELQTEPQHSLQKVLPGSFPVQGPLWFIRSFYKLVNIWIGHLTACSQALLGQAFLVLLPALLFALLVVSEVKTKAMVLDQQH